MQQIIHIGATPPEENCAQFGAASYNEQSLLECSVYKRMLMRTSPPPDGASLLIKSFPYDGGHYREVCVSYEDSSEVACTYAFNLESKGPVEWDPIARYELAWFERRAVFQRGLRDGSVRETDVPAQYARSEPPSEVYAQAADSTASLFALFPILIEHTERFDMSTTLFDEHSHVDTPSARIQTMELRGESAETISLRAIERVLHEGHPLIVGWSSGKDSSVLANLVLTASRNAVKQGIHTPVVITHADTRVENPIVRRIADSEIVKIRAYAKKHGLPVQVLVGRPSISQAWPARVIGGRALPAFPSTRSDCASDWKINTNERNMKIAMQAFSKQGLKEPVVCTGVRLGESAARDAALKARGERGDVPFRNQDGRLMLSPIMAWTLDDVWEHLGLAHAGVIEAYSDFASTIDFYRDAGGTSCVVVSDMAMQGSNKPCGARGGCWACTPSGASDRSMQNLIASDVERYGFMKPLADLRDFLFNTQYDWSRRHYVQRTIKDGFITIGADTYSPNMLAELLRYTLTAQAESGVEIIDPPTLVAIDARWSLYGLHPPFEAIRVWQEIERGRRYHPPAYDRPFPKTEVPVIGKIWVGNDWDDETSSLYAEGLRAPVWEMFSESCGPRLRTFANGKVGLDLEEGLDVDPESAAMFLEWEADRKAAEPVSSATPWTSGYMYYVGLGTIQPAKGQSSMVDDLIRRTGWRQRMDLHGQRSAEELAQRCTVKFPRQADLFS